MRRSYSEPMISGALSLAILTWSGAVAAQAPGAGIAQEGLVRSSADPPAYRVNYRPSENDTWQLYAQYASAAVAVVGLLLVLAAWIQRHATEIVVTDRRVIFKRGLLTRHTVEMNVTKIETVDVEQGLGGRIWGYGTVLIRGTGVGIEPLVRVGAPLSIRNAIIVG